jgi:hypothetical protein
MASPESEKGEPDSRFESSGFILPVGGYSLWKWSAGEARWLQLKDGSVPGFEPGTPPERPGQFDGQIVRWPNTARSGS